MNLSNPPPWKQAAWWDEATTWIRNTLARERIDVTGAIDQVHLRPWSTVLRVPTMGGDVYFKCPASALVHEAGLTEALSRWRPDCILTPLGIDSDRGWMLLPDGGARLRETVQDDGNTGHWEALLPLYAELQIELVAHQDSLLALAVPNRRLATLPERYEKMLCDRELLMIDHQDGLTTDEYRCLIDLVPGVMAACGELEAIGIPESLDHADLHDGNIFLQARRYIFFDWSDSGITHPFFTLRTVLASIEHTLGTENDLPRIRDAYLEPWERYTSRADLLRAFALAHRLWTIPGALVWHRILSVASKQAREAYGYAIPSLLHDLLAAHAHMFSREE